MSKSIEQRFWEKVDKNGPVPAHVPELGQCWVWTGARSSTGYGAFQFKTRTTLKAHRVAYEFSHGTIPRGAGYHGTCILHLCDNRLCVRPAHLCTGSAADNMADMAKKNRAARQCNESHGQHKLTDTQVQEIRHLYASGDITQRELAMQYGVSQTEISVLVTKRGRRFTHESAEPIISPTLSFSNEKNGHCKLSNLQVQALREIYACGDVTQQMLADRFGIGRSHVSRIVGFKNRLI